MPAARSLKDGSRASVSAEDIDEAYGRLKSCAENDEILMSDLRTLKRTADRRLQLSWWSRRFVFGFGAAKAIDEWFHAFDNAPVGKSVVQRIPRDETSNVVAKWLWFGFFGTLVGAAFSLLVAGITAFFFD